MGFPKFGRSAYRDSHADYDHYELTVTLRVALPRDLLPAVTDTGEL